MKDPEHHFITKAINRLRIWFSKKKRLMLQAQDLQRQLAEAWREKAQLEEDVEELLREIKRVPNKLRWVSDNASHHTSSHWLKTQLYGLARDLETGYMNVGTKDFYRVDALVQVDEQKDEG